MLADLGLAVNFARWLLCPTRSGAPACGAEWRPAWLQRHPGPRWGDGRTWASLGRQPHLGLSGDMVACEPLWGDGCVWRCLWGDGHTPTPLRRQPCAGVSEEMAMFRSLPGAGWFMEKLRRTRAWPRDSLVKEWPPRATGGKRGWQCRNRDFLQGHSLSAQKGTCSCPGKDRKQVLLQASPEPLITWKARRGSYPSARQHHFCG